MFNKKQLLSLGARSVMGCGATTFPKTLMMSSQTKGIILRNTLSSTKSNFFFYNQFNLQQGQHFHTSSPNFGIFSNLTNNMSDAFKGLFKKKTLTKEDVEEALQKVRVSLLDADVAESVVSSFIEEVSQDAIGTKAIVGAQVEPTQSALARITKWLGPNQTVEQLPKAATVYLLVLDRLVELLGGGIAPLELNKPSVAKSVIMMAGIQGSGKTTTSAKLALQLKRKENRNVLLVSLDTYRPAAQMQLQTLAQQIQVESLPIVPEEKPIDIARRAMQYVKDGVEFDTIIFDTAGRMHIDDDLMKELEELREIVQPNETLLVADSMLGNDAVNIATQFHDRVGLSGIVLTRMDGSSSGGCAISMKKVVGLSVKFIGIGERMEELERFDPQSLAKRILGGGDILSLAQKAQDAMNMDAAQAQQKIVQFSKGAYTFKDYLDHLEVLKKMGSLKNIASYLPAAALGKFKDKLDSFDMSFIDTHESIISSMSEQEKLQPLLLQSSSARRLDLAKRAKVDVTDINKMLKMYDKIKVGLGRAGAAVVKDPKAMSEMLTKDPMFLANLFPMKVKKQMMRPPKR